MKRWTWALFVAVALILTAGLSNWSGSAAQDKKGHLKFEVYKDAKDEYRWRLKAVNGQIIGTGGQGYKAKADCMHGIDIIKEGAATAKVEEVTEK